MPRPADFSFRFRYHSASVPPPFYHEYRVEVRADGSVEIGYLPDYPQHGAVEQVVHGCISLTELDHFYVMMESAGVFKDAWQIEDPQRIGGSRTSLEVDWSGQVSSVPAGLCKEDAQRLESLYAAIWALIPAEFRDL